MYQSQYQLINEARQVVFDYCKTISNEDFITENSIFGRGSIRNLWVHNANCYLFWLGKFALKNEFIRLEYSDFQSIAEIETLFEKVDTIVIQFIHKITTENITEFQNKNSRDEILTISTITLFTHVCTHEFHHKGQIMSLSRHLGYEPVDTDVIR